jgi:chromosome segregation protein
MYLKTVKVAGFKSFADRTRLEFRPGVGVVVGPNGSGKSNLVDAIHWVMGTQAPTSLRTGKMEDVIFAGTATRPALNRAEVTVIFDNAGREFPLDLHEVAITRRLYRDGSSDYEINGVACRLLDIQELLSDSGVGRHQHVIVNQGQVESVLSASPEEHRAIIEEAAGILKHKLRRERATRRLERTDEDVLRAQDIVGEIVRQMRPLKRQAQAADRHQHLADEAKALTLFLAGEDLRSLDARIGSARGEENEARLASEEAKQEATGLGEQLREVTAQAASVGASLDRDSAAAARLETTVERLRRVAQVAQERHRTRRARVEGASERLRDLEVEAANLSEQVEAARLAENEATTSAEVAERRFRSVDQEAASLTDQEGLSPEGTVAVVTGDLRSLDAADERDQRELESVGQRVKILEGQLGHEVNEVARLGREILSLDEEVSTAQRSYQSAAAVRRRDQQTWEESEAVERSGRLEVAAAQARLEALTLAAAGLGDPIGRDMVASSAGAIGTVSGLLDVPTIRAAAVGSALGDWADAVAFEDATEMTGVVGSLKTSGRGGVGVVRKASPGPARLAATRQTAAELGVEVLIDHLGPGAEPTLAAALLGDVVVVEGWSAGWRLVQRHPELRAVTPEGDLITATGIRVAHPEGADPARVEAAAAEFERVTTEMARAESRNHTQRRQFESARTEERETLELLEATEARLAGAVEAKGRADRAASELGASLARLMERKTALVSSATEREAQRQRLTDTMASLQGAEAEHMALVEERTALRARLNEYREIALTAWQEAAGEASSARSRLTMLQDRLAVVRSEIDRGEGRPVSPAALQRLLDIESVARRAAELLRTKLEELRDRQHTERVTARELSESLAGLRSRLSEAETRISEGRDRLARMALEQTESRVRRESVAEALRREMDASEEEALATPPPAEPVDGSLHELLATRQAELRRMGPVNPLAAEEYRQLSERHEFMAAQLADLESSRQELRKVITALDEEIEGQFKAAFEEVAAAYEQQFGLLFPGGRGRIRLSDPAQPLTTGVEIEAQPLGKKIGRLSLLSGGERSLAALAFLFAVFKARPSPFYVLDEVEAALDDSNLRRFLRLVDVFRAESQLIIITHQQQTMEAADVLYGVTMEPGGSSKVIAKSLSTTFSSN